MSNFFVETCELTDGDRQTELPDYVILYTSCRQHSKSKAVPLHAMEAHGVRGGTAPTLT
jgi:hypothetical protein